MKKTYIIPVQRWAIMEENYLQSLSVIEDYADEEKGLDVKAEHNFGGNDGSKSGNIWGNEW